MKAKFQMLFSAFTLLMSCQKEENTDTDAIYHTWEVKTFISMESVTYPKNENRPILLTFKKDGTYNLKLDINSCGGTFKVRKNNQIEIEFPACTEACCDSQFSNKLAITLPKVASFTIDDRLLQLNVPQWGFIEFELVE